MNIAPKIEISKLNYGRSSKASRFSPGDKIHNSSFLSLPINAIDYEENNFLSKQKSRSLDFEFSILKKNTLAVKGPTINNMNCTSSSEYGFGLSEEAEKFVSARIRSIRSSLTLRGERVKEKMIEKSSDESDGASSLSNSEVGTGESAGVRTFRQRLHSFVPENISMHSSQMSFFAEGSKPGNGMANMEMFKKYAYDKKGQHLWFFPWVTRSPCLASAYVYILPPYYKMDELRFVLWMCLVSIAFLYNMFTIFTRTAFTQFQTTGHNMYYWLAADYFSDFIFIMDIFVHFKCRYLENGQYITDPTKMRQNYMRNPKFRADLMALFPTDLLYLKFGVWPIFRINRMFKAHSLTELYGIFDVILKSAHALRMLKTVLYLLLLINLKACAFYTISRYEGFGINDWVYDGKGRAYLRCFYFGLKTSTGIGNNEGANNNLERIYMTIIWLIGTFSFALFIAQVRAIFEASRRNVSDFRKVLDSTMYFLKNSNIPPYLINKVRMWIIYTWQTQKCLDVQETLGFLSFKMQTDIAINVHFETLSKVKLFQDCERNLLRDLVLKLKPVLYLPGDYICQKGEIGKEMYIINSGIVEVTIGREPNVTILATLKEGSVFGEISLLAIAGENRRTANVRSKGFSNLFVLSKENLEITLSEYPEAKVILEKKAKKILNANKRLGRKSRDSPTKHRGSLPDVKEEDVRILAVREPRLIDTVLRIMNPSSKTVQHLKKGEHFIFEKSDLSLSPTPPSLKKSLVSHLTNICTESPLYTEETISNPSLGSDFHSSAVPRIRKMSQGRSRDRLMIPALPALERMSASKYRPVQVRRCHSLSPLDMLKRKMGRKRGRVAKKGWHSPVSPEIVISPIDTSSEALGIGATSPLEGSPLKKGWSETDLRTCSQVPLARSAAVSMATLTNFKGCLDLRSAKIEPMKSSLSSEHLSEIMALSSSSPSRSSSSLYSASSAPSRL